MQKQILASLTAMLLLFSLFIGCSLNSGSLDIEAQIIYSVGGPQPVARQTFYLLDSDFLKIKTPKPKEGQNPDKVIVESMTALLELYIMIDKGKELPKNLAFETFLKSKPFWESHIVQTIETDFKGKATFENLKPSDYWVVGIAETRASVAIWNYKVSVKRGENKVMLDQNNAWYSK